ncbi:hypothetical protein HO404_02325 [Streptococcus suis]|nr:hypothetical protein [Streptococcus suis]NQM54665.1 hypothetical protein [Streptococcus suis]
MDCILTKPAKIIGDNSDLFYFDKFWMILGYDIAEDDGEKKEGYFGFNWYKSLIV